MMNDDVQTSGLGFVGQSVKRVEDKRLLVGGGTFVADVNPEGVLHAGFVRSPYPHALIKGIDVDQARRMPGVVAVYTGAEMKALTHPFPPFVMLPNLYTPLYWPLSDDKVRMVGDPVAMVIAESRYVAEDAIEAVSVEYEPLRSVADVDQALAPTTEPLWDKADGNLLYDQTDRFGDLAAVFANADRVVTERFSCHRQSNQPMETRGTVVEVDSETGHLTIHSATQSSHMLRWMASALTGKESTLSSIRKIASNGERRKGFFSAAKQFVSENAESLQASDNAGPAAQLKKNPGFLAHVSKIGLGTLAKDDYPTVKARDIGGGFGSKGSVAREDIALVAAASDLGRSVRWIEDRVENLTDGGHAREEEIEISIALDDDGRFRGLKVDLIMDQGAYPAFPVGAAVTTRIMKVLFPGAYKWDAFQMRSRIVATNKGKYVAYRGPWANETWVRERIIDVAARALGLSPTEVRLRNLFGDEDMPNAMLTGPTLDETMSTRKTLERAIELMDVEGFERRKAEAAAAGRRLGIGFASYHEPAPGPPNYAASVNPGTDALLDEVARTTVEADGSILVFTSQMPHGQSHETTYAQVAADQLGVGIDDITLVWGNTDRTTFSFLGTGGSRGGPLGGGAVRGSAREVRKKIVDRAADLLEANPDDIVIERGRIHVAGVPSRALSFAEIAAETSAGGSPAFEHTTSYGGAGDGGWSCATHACIVEVDLETGMVDFDRYIVVEDCGPIINPAIVDGQVRGGVAQAIGAVLYENSSFDDDANLTATTYMDYLIPTTMEIPEIEVHHLETLSPGENDYRGVGEGGMLGGPAAITNAIEDALAPLGVTITEQFLPPTRILELAGVIEPDEHHA